jgi:hypothetical protein
MHDSLGWESRLQPRLTPLSALEQEAGESRKTRHGERNFSCSPNLSQTRNNGSLPTIVQEIMGKCQIPMEESLLFS